MANRPQTRPVPEFVRAALDSISTTELPDPVCRQAQSDQAFGHWLGTAVRDVKLSGSTRQGIGQHA